MTEHIWPWAQTFEDWNGTCRFCGREFKIDDIGYVETDARKESVVDPETGITHETVVMGHSCQPCAEARKLPWLSHQESEASIDWDENRLDIDQAWAAAERGDSVPPTEAQLEEASALGRRLRQELFGLDSEGPLDDPRTDWEYRMTAIKFLKAGAAMAAAGYGAGTDEGMAFTSGLLHMEWR